MVSKDLNSNRYFEYINCPICGNHRLSMHFSVPYGRLKQKKSLDYSLLGIDKETIIKVDKCNRCKFVFVNPRIKKEYEGLLYNESKYNLYKENRKFELNTSENIQFTRQRRLKYLNILLRVLNIAGRDQSLNLFDYGCGFGHTLSLADSFGINGMGVEIDTFRLDYCKNLGLKVFSVEEFKKKSMDQKFDIIICQSVVEHIIDLKDFLSFIDMISKEKTILYINGVSPHLIKLENKKGLFVKAHFLEHANYFYETTLDSFMGKIGFRPFPKKVVLVNGKKLLIPSSLVKLIKRDNGFFERIYVKKEGVR
ncbi:MAG: methyltransferase domain-containing protein [Candidatus Omnitrophota bacterium]|nr:MAG: methyltransferase domain-containing protein [Candidatus Omnitrophota bacterium]